MFKEHLRALERLLLKSCDQDFPEGVKRKETYAICDSHDEWQLSKYVFY
jgi:hypothetical protein